MVKAYSKSHPPAQTFQFLEYVQGNRSDSASLSALPSQLNIQLLEDSSWWHHADICISVTDPII